MNVKTRGQKGDGPEKNNKLKYLINLEISLSELSHIQLPLFSQQTSAVGIVH